VDRQWYGKPLLWTRDDASGVWHHTEHVPQLPKPAAAAPAQAAAAAAAKAPTPLCNGSTAQPDSSPAPVDYPPVAQDAHSQQAAVHPIVLATRAKMHQQQGQGQAPMQEDAAAAAGAEAGAGAEAAATDVRSSGSESSGGLRDAVEEALKSCLVLVDVDIPLVALSDGVHSRSFAGNGLVVYHGDNLGLVLVRRTRCAVL
jgi:cytoskeletal protein RodZ